MTDVRALATSLRRISAQWPLDRKLQAPELVWAWESKLGHPARS
jgi:hypothetical protein